MKIIGFDHGQRGIGIRNFQLILPSVVCSTHISKKIADAVGGKTFAHNTGCGIIGSDVPGIGEFFEELAGHPNVNSVLVVGLGCETIQGNELAEQLIAKNKSTKYLIIQESGGMGATLQKGVTAAKELNNLFPETKSNLSELLVGVESSVDLDQAKFIISELENVGIKTLLATGDQTGINFTELMRGGAHLIISLVAPDQPPTGYPIIPIINIATNSPLHTAISTDFDLLPGYTSAQLIELILNIANGTQSKAEVLNIGEIFAPRVVRSA